MKPKVLLRIASLLLVLFAMGHSTGHYRRKNTTDPAGKAVLRAMEDYQFEFKGKMQTLDGHMEGYGWLVTLVLLSFAALLWIVSSNYEKQPAYSRLILYPFLFFMAGNGIVAYRYFFSGPAVISAVAVLLTVIAAFRMKDNPVGLSR